MSNVFDDMPEVLFRHGLPNDEERGSAMAWLESRISKFVIDGLDAPWTSETANLAKRLGATGFDLNLWWLLTPTSWSCLCCKRVKRDIARLNKRGQLIGHLVEHHDHMSDLVKKTFVRVATERSWPDADEKARGFAKRVSGMISAFEAAIICEDCNQSDAKAKSLIRAPKDFSFSPDDIASFVRPQPNREHSIDADEAR